MFCTSVITSAMVADRTAETREATTKMEDWNFMVSSV